MTLANPALPITGDFWEIFPMVSQSRMARSPRDGNRSKISDRGELRHAMGIVTMAIWLSAAVFSALALIDPKRKAAAVFAKPEKDEALAVTLEAPSGGDLASASAEPAADAPPLRPLLFAPVIPRPPAMPLMAASTPLPEIPDFPVARRVEASTPTLRNSGAAIPSSSSGRFAAGNTPSAPYPPYSERNGQEGTVIVEFAVDSGGRVTAVFIKQPCQWPLLNHAALRAVYSWSFPPGAFDTFECPVVFKIN